MDLFNIENKEFSLDVFGKNINVKYPVARPKSGIINVLKDFPWKNGGDVDEVPSISVKEYTLSFGQTVTNLQRLIETSQTIIESGNIDPYLIMYTADPTGFNYVFPHLLKGGDTLRSIGNQWDTQAQTVDKLALEGLQALDSIVGGVVQNMFTGVGYEPVKNYSGTSQQSIKFSFPLYNTIDTKSAYRNYSLVTLLAFQNLKTRTSFLTYIPPKIYTIYNIYNGGVYMPVAQLSNFSVTSIGTSRVLSEYNNTLIPEAYKVEIEFTELVTQSSNIFLGTVDNRRVELINNTDSITNVIRPALK